MMFFFTKCKYSLEMVTGVVRHINKYSLLAEDLNLQSNEEKDKKITQHTITEILLEDDAGELYQKKLKDVDDVILSKGMSITMASIYIDGCSYEYLYYSHEYGKNIVLDNYAPLHLKRCLLQEYWQTYLWDKTFRCISLGRFFSFFFVYLLLALFILIFLLSVNIIPALLTSVSIFLLFIFLLNKKINSLELLVDKKIEQIKNDLNSAVKQKFT